MDSKRSFLCRFNISHKWRGAHSDHGERFQRCLKCGKERDIPHWAAGGGAGGGAVGGF